MRHANDQAMLFMHSHNSRLGIEVLQLHHLQLHQAAVARVPFEWQKYNAQGHCVYIV